MRLIYLLLLLAPFVTAHSRRKRVVHGRSSFVGTVQITVVVESGRNTVHRSIPSGYSQPWVASAAVVSIESSFPRERLVHSFSTRSCQDIRFTTSITVIQTILQLFGLLISDRFHFCFMNIWIYFLQWFHLLASEKSWKTRTFYSTLLFDQ